MVSPRCSYFCEVIVLLEEVVVNGVRFLVDKNATSQYITQHNKPCNCAYCRNYFKAIQEIHSVLSLLNRFQVNVGRPEECMELETNFDTNMLFYYVWYSVSGKATQKVVVDLSDDIVAEIYPPADEQYAPNTGQTENYFWISLNLLLPWVLEEDINQLKPPIKRTVIQKVLSVFKRGESVQ